MVFSYILGHAACYSVKGWFMKSKEHTFFYDFEENTGLVLTIPDKTGQAWRFKSLPADKERMRAYL